MSIKANGNRKVYINSGMQGDDAKTVKQTFNFHFQPTAVEFLGKQTLGGD